MLEHIKKPETYSKVDSPTKKPFENILFLIGGGDEEPRIGEAFMKEKLRKSLLNPEKNPVFHDIKQAVEGNEAESLKAIKKLREFKYANPDFSRQTPHNVKNIKMTTFERSVFHLGMGHKREFEKGKELVLWHRDKFQEFSKHAQNQLQKRRKLLRGKTRK